MVSLRFLVFSTRDSPAGEIEFYLISLADAWRKKKYREQVLGTKGPE
jgi:hypothetical protein